MQTRVDVHLRFRSKTALTRARKAFDAIAHREFIASEALVWRELSVSVERALEVEADVGLWPAFQSLAREANEGFVVFDEGTAGVGALHALISEGEGQRLRWVEHACTPNTPSAEMCVAKVTAKKRRSVSRWRPPRASTSGCIKRHG